MAEIIPNRLFGYYSITRRPFRSFGWFSKKKSLPGLNEKGSGMSTFAYS